MGSCGLDVLSKLAEWTSLDVLREDFPRKSDEGLTPSEVRNECHVNTACDTSCNGTFILRNGLVRRTETWQTCDLLL